MMRSLPAATCGSTTGAVAETTSTWPPINAVTDSPDERNGAMVSLSIATPATCSGLAIAMWMFWPSAGATAMRSAAGSALSALTRSLPLCSGESARTATTEVSSTSMATGMNSRGSALISPVTAPAMAPVWKVPR